MKALEILKVCRERGQKRAGGISLDEAIAEIEALQQRSCKTCKYYDTERPKSHPNYAECNNRDCPLSYVEVYYAFCCNRYEAKEQ